MTICAQAHGMATIRDGKGRTFALSVLAVVKVRLAVRDDHVVMTRRGAP